MTATARNGAAPHRRLAPAVRTACLLLALACLAPLAVQAADPILVSNQTKTVRNNPYVGDSSYAQQFRTGSASGVYAISDVILTFSKAADRGTTTVTVRSDSSGNPADAALATMTLDSAGMGNIAFTPSSPVRLEPQTRYWVVAEHSTGGTSGPRWARVHIADGLDADSAAGWEIDQSYQEERGGGWIAPQNMSQAMKIRLRGTVVPAVTIASDGDVTEGNAASFTLTRGGDTADALEVGVTVSETGDMVASGDEGTKKATFAAGSATATVTVPTQADSASEPDSTVTVAVADGDGYVAGTPSQAGVVVADDDDPVVTITSGGNVTEGAAARFNLTRTGNRAAALTVEVTVSETGGMVASGDEGTRTVRFSAGSGIFQLAVATQADSTHEPDSTVTVTVVDGSDYDPGTPSQADVVVSDDDNAAPTGAPTIDDTTPLVGETLTADASGISDADGLTGATFTWQWLRVSGSTETRIPGATAATYTVVAADEGATLKVEATFTDDDGTEETVESAETSTVEVPPLPRVSVARVESPVEEGEHAQFTVTRTVVTTGALTVHYSVSETGAMVASGEEGAKTLDFSGNTTSLTVTVPTVDDSVHEADSVVTLTLTADAAYDLGATVIFSDVTVQDNDNADPTGAPTISDTTPVVGETLTADESDIADPDGLTGATFTWQWIQVASDNTETRISGATAATYTVATADVGATLKVEASFTDDDGTTETLTSAETATVELPGLSIDDASVDEGDSGSTTMTFTVTLSHAATETVTVDWTTQGGTATAGTDYTAGNGTLTFNAGDSSKTVSVSVVGDDVDEPDEETFTVTLSSASGATISDGTATGTIRDDDAEPTVTLALTPVSISENGEVGTVTATLGNPSSEATTVTVSVAPVSPAVAGDYMLSGSELTIPAGETDSRGVVTIAAVNNHVYEGDKTVTVSGTATNSQGITAPQSVTLTITDDELPPGLSVADASVDEGHSGSTTMTFTVRLNPMASGQVTVDWATSDGTATAGTDYTAGNGSLTFNAGDSSKTVSVSVTGDDVDEPDEETFTVTLASASGATIGDAEATGTIRDDDDTPTVTLVLTPVSIDENGGTSTVTARLNHPSSEATTVTVSVEPESPAVADDYTLSANRELTIPAGSTTSTGTVTISAVNNDVDAADRKVTVSAVAENAQGVTDPDAVTLTITNDDAAVVELHLSSASISEDGGESTVTASLSHPSSEETTVTVTVEPVPPAVEVDYTLSGSRLTIAAGSTTSTGEVTITAVDNDVEAPHKTVTVSATATNARGVTDPEAVTLTITDDENVAPTGAPTIDDTTPVVGETLTVDTSGIDDPDGLTNPSFTYQWVRVASGGGETVVGTGKSYTVAAGDVGATLKVVVSFTDDGGTVETVEFEARSAVVLPVLTIADASVDEGDSGDNKLRFTVRLAPAATGEVTVDWATTDGTATAGQDYTEGGGSLRFNAGDSSKTVSVTVADDDVDEPDETFTVTLSNPSGATLGDDTATGTITNDDDDPTVTLVLTPDTIAENGGTSTVTAHLDHPSSEETTVTVSVAPVSPAEEGDYTLSANRELTIAAGATTSTGTVTVTGVDNDVEAPDKTVTVSGTATNNQGVKNPEAVVTLTLRDDDLPDGRRRRLEYALASFGRTVAQDLVTAVEDRRWATGTTATLAGTRLSLSEEAVYEALRRHTDPDGDLMVDPAALREMLSRSSFQVSLGGEGEAGGMGADSLVLWGRGSRSWSAGRLDSEVETQGEALSGQLGVEFRVREDTLVGVMLNGSAGEVEFDGALDTEVETEVETDVLGVHPYAQWSPWQGLRTWAMVGYGAGEATLTDKYSALSGTDLKMMMAAGGGSHDVASRWGVDWSVGTNGFVVQLDADEVRFDAEGQAALVPAVQSEVWQMRLLLEGSAGEDFGGVEGLRGNVELAARVDGGDAESGLGMEVGGGVGYGRADLGIEVDASGRVLLTHEEEGLEDAGVSLALEVDPGERGRGPYFALSPSWGNAASGARSMWEDRQPTVGGSGGGARFEPEMRLSSELGYAAPTPVRRGTLTTYGAFSSAGGASRQYRIGRRLELGIASMSLEAERRESVGATPEHGVWLRGNLRF